MFICNLCPNKCGVDREKETGKCGVKTTLKIAKYDKFTYEEPCISGTKGSGAIFFCGCPMKCIFCQNYEVSRNKVGKEITVEDLAEIFKKLENAGCHNINLVNPTHYVPQIIKAFEVYTPKIPIVYNTHGYENLETLKAIDKYVSVYLPDLKYYTPKMAERYSGKSDYFEKATEAIKFMAKKPCVIEDGIMKSGCIVRHLILPMNTYDSLMIVEWIKDNLPESTYLSLMSQYTPFGEIEKCSELQRPITKKEYKKIFDKVCELDMKNVFVQDEKSVGTDYIPKWES